MFDRQWQALRAYARERGVGLHRRRCPSSSPTTAPTSGATRTRFRLDAQGQPTHVVGRSTRLLQQDRPALGHAALPLEGASRARAIASGSSASARTARALRCRPARPLHRLRALLGDRGERADRRARTLAQGARSATCSRSARVSSAHLPFIAEDLGSVTPKVRALRDRLQPAGHARAAVRLRRRPARRPFLPHNYIAQLRGLHRHARQRHHRRLVRGPRRRGRRAHARASGARSERAALAYSIAGPARHATSQARCTGR